MTPIKNLLIVTKDHKITTYEEVNQISMVTPDEIQVHHLGEYESRQINMIDFVKLQDIIRIELNRGSEDEVIFNQINFPEEEIPMVKPQRIIPEGLVLITKEENLKLGHFYFLGADISKRDEFDGLGNYCYIGKKETTPERYYFLGLDPENNVVFNQNVLKLSSDLFDYAKVYGISDKDSLLELLTRCFDNFIGDELEIEMVGYNQEVDGKNKFYLDKMELSIYEDTNITPIKTVGM